LAVQHATAVKDAVDRARRGQRLDPSGIKDPADRFRPVEAQITLMAQLASDVQDTIGATGPKISSLTMPASGATSVSTVGATKCPVRSAGIRAWYVCPFDDGGAKTSLSAPLAARTRSTATPVRTRWGSAVRVSPLRGYSARTRAMPSTTRFSSTRIFVWAPTWKLADVVV
jgi:hypothetical protein